MVDHDWRAAHQRQILDKQRRVSQTLAQVRELMALIRKWRHNLGELQSRFGDLESGAAGVGWFDRHSLVAMGSIGEQLERMLAEFEQIGETKTIGSGSAGRERGGVVADRLAETADPAREPRSWEVVWQVEPAVSEAVRDGVDLLAAEPGADPSALLVTAEDSQVLGSAWAEVGAALSRMAAALDGFDLPELEDLEGRLVHTLRDYERIYDGARGADDMSAAALRRLASGARRR